MTSHPSQNPQVYASNEDDVSKFVQSVDTMNDAIHARMGQINASLSKYQEELDLLIQLKQSH